MRGKIASAQVGAADSMRLQDHGMGNHMTTGHTRMIMSTMIALAAVSVLGAGSSHGQALSSGETARLLARVEAIDGKCRYLSPADHDVLKTFVARAEVAAAGEGGPQEASEAVASGRAEGGSAACSDESARLVRAAYASAQSAASGVRRGQAAAAAPTSRQMPPPQRNRQMEVWPGPAGDATSRYARRLEAYYLNLRCRYLTRPDAVRFWQSIVQDQRNAARESGPQAVAAVQQRARVVAGRAWCGGNTARRVIDGYRGLVSR
jgi:hypothetical protein